jgi:hypothetical protein
LIQAKTAAYEKAKLNISNRLTRFDLPQSLTALPMKKDVRPSAAHCDRETELNTTHADVWFNTTGSACNPSAIAPDAGPGGAMSLIPKSDAPFTFNHDNGETSCDCLACCSNHGLSKSLAPATITSTITPVDTSMGEIC